VSHHVVVSRSRDRVVDTALHLFADQGYSAVGMRSIADELGIRAPSLYSHFPSKDAMLRAVLEPFIASIELFLAQAPQTPVSEEARRVWLTGATELLRENSLQLQLVTSDRTLALHPTLGPRFFAMTQQVAACLGNLGMKHEQWGMGLAGAIIYQVLSPVDPPSAAEIVQMAEAFIDAG
jgi:AcrR family transcriptional regulator